MARTKRTSNILESAQTRLAALSSIDPKLSLGTGLGISDYDAQVTCTRQALDAYNTPCSRRWTRPIIASSSRKRACAT